jgi:hypothetical protein
MAAFYKANVAEFLAVEPSKLMLGLTTGTSGLGFDLKADQHSSWLAQLDILGSALRTIVATEPGAAFWSVLLEYQIPGRAKRLDAVLLDGFGIIALEFKIGADAFHSGDKWQLLEYCWDLRDFHRESEGIPIVPVLIATNAAEKRIELDQRHQDKDSTVLPLLTANSETLASILITSHEKLKVFGAHPLDMKRWDESQAHRTRTVIEEAQRLFGSHDAREISHVHADNTTIAQNTLIEIVRESRARNLRSICFVTGVPGAGKTLVGLHAAFSADMTSAAGKPAYFASGNKPLLDVLEAALTLNRSPNGQKKRENRHSISSPFQNVHEFALRNLLDSEKRPPLEHVVVFDEAQRVWTCDKVEAGISKRVQRRQLTNEQSVAVLRHNHSEPELLLRVMERCPEWCVVIALIGGGQEIYDGEAGLGAWGAALKTANQQWVLWVAPAALEGDASVAGQTLFPIGKPTELDVRPSTQLHLSVAKRSPRAERYADWVNNVVNGQAEAAFGIMASLKEFPILLTRELNCAKLLIREYAGEAARYGLVASSGAMRLRADGVELKREFRNSIKFPDWFLRPPGDIRSSNQLEVAATEFECQGLELDWTLVCWGGDYIPNEGRNGWFPRVLHNGGKNGPHWRKERDPIEQEFVRNKYRVLLTRARFGTVIYVPRGNSIDQTRNPLEFDSIASFLVRCGLEQS